MSRPLTSPEVAPAPASYTVKIRGVEVHCDSLDAVGALVERYGGEVAHLPAVAVYASDGPPPRPSGAREPRPGATAITFQFKSATAGAELLAVNDGAHGRPPWGIVRGAFCWALDERSAHVREAFERAVEGETPRQIAVDFNKRSVPTRNGKPNGLWHASAVESILKNEAYCGRWVVRGEVVPVPPVVTPEVWRRAQLALKSQVGRLQRPRHQHSPRVEPAAVAPEPEDEPAATPWFRATAEPLPDTSGMTRPEAQVALAGAAVRGCSAAVGPLLDSISWLIYKLARKHARARMDDACEEDIEDICAGARMRIFRKLDQFDPSRASFVTWSWSWILYAIGRHIDDFGRTIRVPVHVKDRERKIYAVECDLRRQLDREPTDDEVCWRARISQLQLERARHSRENRKIYSLDAPITAEDERTFMDSVAAPDHDEPEALGADEVESLRRYVEELRPAEREIIKRRYGLDGEEMTLAEVGDQIGVSRERVRQIQEVALKALRARVKRDEFGSIE